MRLIRSAALSLLLGTCALPALNVSARAQIVVTVVEPPPPLPVYLQPPIPEPGYIWTPGYWDYGNGFGYYWVPGTWVEAPRPGLLWTPGYWGFERGTYGFHRGYWGEQVGFYGGVNYGYGYGAAGYDGGRWTNGQFFYNRAVNNVSNVTITNVYSGPAGGNAGGGGVSFNGGQGGLAARPSAQQLAFAAQPHVEPTATQQQHVQLAARDPALREAQNKGLPPVAATSRPAQFGGAGVVPARTAGARPAGQPIPQGKAAPRRARRSTGRRPAEPRRRADGTERPTERGQTRGRWQTGGRW